MRKPIIAGNWKMNKTIDQGISFVNEIKEKIAGTDAEVVLCPPATMLAQLKQAATGTGVKIGAQNMHQAEDGAFTGEISAAMLSDLKIDYVIIGHSERRQYFNETDQGVNEKVLKALETGITPILCCGETLEEREAGNTNEVVKKQVLAGLEGVPAEKAATVVIAYEPIWAIGTGKTATSEDANTVISFIRESVDAVYGKEVSEAVRIQYGGSVKPSNVKTLMAETDIDGALVGGASLDPESFLGLLDF
ncbi:MAG: triose-phosphate isomerase [Desulfobacteraceae bacterium]|nr:triose-phosphate isomerase [Desulfobacteraceae bacterium]